MVVPRLRKTADRAGTQELAQSLKRFDSRNGVAMFNTGNVVTEQTRMLLNIAQEKKLSQGDIVS